LSLFQGDIPTAVQKAQLALVELPAQDAFLRSMATIVLASAAQLQNQDDRGLQFHDQAIQESLESGNLLLSISMLSSLANLLQKEGRLALAEEKYRQALELAVDAHGRPLPIATRPMVGLVSIALERNQMSGVETQLQEAVQLSQSWRKRLGECIYDLAALKNVWAGCGSTGNPG
jgi:ATP/maltotriose-dependent transcriptional regulator MalT